MTPGMPGAVLTTIYYLLLVAAMPLVVAARWCRKQPTQGRAALALLALTTACVVVGYVLWRATGSAWV